MSTKPSPSVEDAGSAQAHAAAEYERIKQNFRPAVVAHDAPSTIPDAQLMFQDLQQELEEFLIQHMTKVVGLRDVLSTHFAKNDSVAGHAVHEESSGTAAPPNTHLARSRTISNQRSVPMSASGHGHLDMKTDTGLSAPHPTLPSVTQYSSHHGHVQKVAQVEDHFVALENFLEAHMENVRELQLALRPGASHMPDVRIHPHSAAVTQELHTMPEQKLVSYESHHDDLTDQFNTVIIISTFSGVLIAVFIAMVQNILIGRHNNAFNVGMLFSFFSLATHLGNIIVAGRGASITSQQFAGHTKAQDLTYFKFYLSICRHLQLFGTLFFVGSVAIMSFIIFTSLVFPLILLFISLFGMFLVLFSAYWKVSLTFQNLKFFIKNFPKLRWRSLDYIKAHTQRPQA